MIKILYTINFLTNGGPTRVLQNIIKGLDTTKYEVKILTIIDQNDKKIVSDFEKKDIEIICLKYNKNLKEIIKNKNEIVNIINEYHPDIIHTHGIVTTFIAKDKNIKCKKITTIHNNIYEDYRYTYGKVKGFIFARAHIAFLSHFDNVICCSKTSYDVLKGKVDNLSYIRNGVDVVHSNSIDENKCKIRNMLNIKDNDIVYIYGGVINNRKRVSELIELFNDTLKEDEYLIIVGDGPLFNEANQKAINNRIIFTGFKTNIIDYFEAADIYTSYSSSEGFSISIIEALSSGLVCFVSDIPSHKECYEIDNNYYIGEYFNKDNFNYKKELVNNKMKNVDRKQIIEFQSKYLSSESMSKEYMKYYEVN